MCWYYIPKYSCGHTGTPSSIIHRCDSYTSTPREACTPEEMEPEYNHIDRECDACERKRKGKK